MLMRVAHNVHRVFTKCVPALRHLRVLEGKRSGETIPAHD